MSGRGLDRLQAALDSGKFPASWPKNVCRNAHCGHWERNNGLYYWHRPSDHGQPEGEPGALDASGSTPSEPSREGDGEASLGRALTDDQADPAPVTNGPASARVGAPPETP